MTTLDAAYFLLSEWLWNVSWGWYHIPVNVVLLYLFFMWAARLKSMPSLLLCFSSHLFAFGLYSLIVVGGLIYGMHLEYTPQAMQTAYDTGVLEAAIGLAIIYAVLQGFFFFVIKKRYKLRIRPILTATLLSNLLSALCVYLLLPARL